VSHSLSLYIVFHFSLTVMLLLLPWCGVVWCGVVWCGVVWRGAVWCQNAGDGLAGGIGGGAVAPAIDK